MPALPSNPVDERRLLKLVKNHGEFQRILTELAMTSDLGGFEKLVSEVALCWLRLGIEHREDARACLVARRERASVSRAYYAAYNASKAVRYRVTGIISLKGDDHQKVSELPDDFNNVTTWARILTTLYEHRLRSDYDNWSQTPAEQTLTASDCVDHADGFITDCRTYLAKKFGMTP